MSRNILAIVCLVAAFVFSSCQKDNDGPEDVIVNVEDDFYFDLWEQVDVEGRSFNLLIETIQNYDCLNNSLGYSLDISHADQIITLSVNEITEPVDCVQGEGPVRGTVSLGSLPVGVFHIRINFKNAVFNQGLLTISDTDYELEMETSNGFILRQTVLNRIPENTIWGYVTYDMTDDEADSKAFIENLGDLSTVHSAELSRGYIAGYYGYFTIEEDRDIIWNQELSAPYSLPIVYFYEADLQETESLVALTCSDDPRFDIQLFSDQGDYLTCP